MKKILDALNSPRRNTRDLSMNILVTLAMAAVFTVINPNFIDRFNLISIGQNLAPNAMLALGVIMPIAMGCVDLSIGAVCIGAATVGGTLLKAGVPLYACIPVMIAFGGLAGLLNGYLVAKKHLQPFITTLGTMMFIRGATAIFANASTVMFPSDTWYNDLFSTWMGFPTGFAWIALFTALVYFVFRKTRTGRYLVSIGSNERAVRVSGVDVDKYIIIGYIGSGLMAGISAIFWSASFATISVGTGPGMELDAIAAVFISGTAAAGGLANVPGCVIGSLMLVVIRSGLNFALARMNVSINSTFVTYVISGIIVVAAVMADKSRSRSRRTRKNAGPYSAARRRIAAYAVSLALLVFLTAASVTVTGSGDREAGPAGKMICLLMRSEGNDFWDTVAEGAKAAGKEKGYTVICRGAEGEDASFLPKEREILDMMLTEEPVGIGVSTIADGYSDLLEEAYERKIPVVQYDAGVYQADLDALNAASANPIVCTVVADNYENAAEAAGKVFPAVRQDIISADVYPVGIIQHANNESAEERAKGFADAFMKLAEADPETAGKCRMQTEVKPTAADNAYKDALEYLFEKNVRLIFGTSGGVINQCYDAVHAADGKYDGLKFAGYDDETKAREWIKDTGSATPMIGSASQNPYQMGYITVQAMMDIAEGKKVEEKIVVRGEWICPDNVQ